MHQRQPQKKAAETKSTEATPKSAQPASTRSPTWTNALGSQPALALQPKLTVNQPGDEYEQEADRVAAQVMRMATPAVTGVQRCACGGVAGPDGECPACKAKRLGLQRKGDGIAHTEAPPSVHQTLRSSGQPLDTSTRAFMEPRFGQDFSSVRVHTDSQAAQSAADVSARAYTVGNNVVFGAGEYAPETDIGKQLLAHELTHTMQQRGGIQRVQRTMEECIRMMSRSTPISRLSGSLVHRLIQADFARTPGAVNNIMIPGASAAPQRTQGLCGEDSNIIPPQILGGRAGAGFPDLALITTGGILQVGEIKPASPDCLVDGEMQLLRYIEQGNATDAQQIAWRASLGITAVEPIPESAYTPPTLTTGNFTIETAWCSPGMMIYNVSARGIPFPVPSPETSRERQRENERRRTPDQAPAPAPVPVPARSITDLIKEFAQRVIQSGVSAEQAAEEMFRQHPEIAATIIGLGLIAIVAIVADDFGGGFADDVAIPPIITLLRVAWRFV